MVIFESIPAFLSVYIPLVLLGFFGIIFEERIAEAEQRLRQRLEEHKQNSRKADDKK